MEKMKEKPKVSIGFPIFNEEKLLTNKIEALLSQTFDDFELIISDNGSTDLTEKICREFAEKDSRIRYFRHEKNSGQYWNLRFVLSKAIGDYFLWTAADDDFVSTFIERCVKILDTKENVIGVFSKIKVKQRQNRKFSRLNEKLEKIGLSFRPMKLYSISGSYEEKVRSYFKEMPWPLMWSVFRREQFQKSCIVDSLGYDAVCVLNTIKFGDIHCIDEELFFGNAVGSQSAGMITIARIFNKGILGRIFPYYPLSRHLYHILGPKLFLKSFHYILRINLDASFLIFVDILEKTKQKFS